MSVHAIHAVEVVDDHRPAPSHPPRRRIEFLIGAFLARYGVPTTQEAYRLDMKLWLAFLDEHGCDDPFDVRRSHLEVFMRTMEDRGRMASTVYRRASTIHTFYEYLVDEDVLHRNPVRGARRPHVPRESTRLSLGIHELTRWLDAAEEEGGYVHALALLLAMNGLRISEATKADVDHLYQDRWHWVLSIVGKGDQPDIVAVPPPTVQALKEALGGREEGPLLLNTLGSRMDREAAARIVSRLCRKAGVTKRITPHSLRHSAITLMLNAGVPLRDVQRFARHADPRTTERYDRDRRKLDGHGSYILMQTIGSARSG